ncbi:hypothetical protein LKL95_27900 [Bacillus cereus]|uniref:hypothetical protein n=1 Tax=Bacillus cereus group TaxID=86661 RepID=UPI0007ABDB1D|nr:MULTISPECIES: hypothetical protein [Bacillus cereus group]KZD31816.1 hypothetical protein B4081_3252 [Bacillus cereus]MCC2397604.1 hypothetical protein [Bacillus cereus]MCU5662877.1 hypothetical protein [Bacillus cereus]PFJ48664.1 hypothetical protein COJ02_29280 [Bacillus thuringiensis]PFV50174.1 hypothetical protein COL09_29860 [Bacillus cereus]
MSLYRNFLIYNISSGTLNVNCEKKNVQKKRPPKKFEKISYAPIQKNMYSLTYKWIDKLRISDKYSKPIFNEVQSIFIENIGRLAVFGNSESNINYFCNKISEKYNISLELVPYYQFLKKDFLADNLTDEIIGYEIKNPKLSMNDENFEKFSGEKMMLDHLKKMILENEESIVSITLDLDKNNISYYIDPCSVISLSDNIDKTKFYSILNLICRRYQL